MSPKLSITCCLEYIHRAIEFVMSENTFDIESVCQLEALSKSLGGIAECKRLGFVFTDEKGIMFLSVAGLSYLLFVKGAGHYQRGRSLRRRVPVRS
jgi:hypothetical protein